MYATVILISIPTGLFVVGVIALIFLTCFLLSGIFGPTPKYDIANREQLPANDSPNFLVLLESMVDAKVNRAGSLEILKNGPAFYTAELEAIRNARRSVNLEAYIFQKSAIGSQYLEAMAERARSGVAVNVVLDAFGSASVTRAFFRPLLDAGGKVNWYNSPAWYRMTQLDNRTHRELLIVDGQIGFIGGAGIADQWFSGAQGQPRWRDTVVRVQGEAVPNLQATFAENWLAACGELLTGDAYFPEIAWPHKTAAMVINSTPTVGGSTRARILFQLLLASAKRSISITTPYFLPDKSLMRELCRAIEDRGVKVRILVPGRKSDHLLTRSTSRGRLRPTVEGRGRGLRVPAFDDSCQRCCASMGYGAVVGSTNFDNRSFGINDEINLAVCDSAFAERLERDMSGDLEQSRRVSLDEWRKRPVTERAPELLGWILERQQ